MVLCAAPRKIKEIMLAAEELNMVASGEYVFFNIELRNRFSFLLLAIIVQHSLLTTSCFLLPVVHFRPLISKLLFILTPVPLALPR